MMSNKSKKVSRVESFQKQVKNFVNRELMPLKRYPGASLDTNPVNTTERLYREVLLTGLIRA